MADADLILRLLPAVIGGIYTLIGIAGLVTGGARKGRDIQASQLYDRVYFLLRIFFGATILGVGVVFWSITGHDTTNQAVDLCVRASGLCLVAMVLPMIMRGNMMYRAAKYLVENGSWAMRWLHRLYILRFEYYGAVKSKINATLIGLMGATLLFLGSYIFELVAQAKNAIRLILGG
ncbi:MAG: hypothetical protein QM647_03915 [Asticcacaulis sp.]|uniref:hypothetical protein n=1 Tax=Asticcacaulis sp. TaxID=1872648 RepID=UPI0039E6F424